AGGGQGGWGGGGAGRGARRRWPASWMDGSALRGQAPRAAPAGAPARLAVAGRVPAGGLAERPLRPGEAFRIFTGAPLPEGADSVIPQEDVTEEGGTLEVPRPVRDGDFVRPRREAMRPRDPPLHPGPVPT